MGKNLSESENEAFQNSNSQNFPKDEKIQTKITIATMELEKKENSQLTKKEIIEKILLGKFQQKNPQTNHLLKKLVGHMAVKMAEEPNVNLENTITPKMIKDSLHGEGVNYGRKNSFNAEEDQKILDMVMKIGKNWKAISLILKNKSPNMIKNRYYTYLKKKFDRKYSDMLSQKSISTNDSVKIEEESHPMIMMDKNSKHQMENQNLKVDKVENIKKLIKINQFLDLEKKKTLMNIASLQANLFEKEKKIYENILRNENTPQLFEAFNYQNYMNYFAPMNETHKLYNNMINLQIPPEMMNPSLVNHQISILQKLINDALMQINHLQTLNQKNA